MKKTRPAGGYMAATASSQGQASRGMAAGKTTVPTMLDTVPRKKSPSTVKKGAKGKKGKKKAPLKSAIPLLLPSKVICLPEAPIKTVLEDCGYGQPSLVVQKEGTGLQYTHPSHTEDSWFIINPTAITMISQLEGRFSVLLVTGPAGSKKSSFLSVFCQAAGIRSARFPNKTKAGSVGIWFWPQLVTIPTPAGETKVLVMDCESLDPANIGNVEYLEQLLGIGSLCSSVMVYNTMGYPLNLEKMQSLECAAQVLLNSASPLTEGNPLPFPYLAYLLRDWPQNIPLDPAHPLVLETKDSKPSVLQTNFDGRHMFLTLPIHKTVTAKKTKKATSKSSTAKPKPKPKGKKSKAGVVFSFKSCDEAFKNKVQLVQQHLAACLEPLEAIATGESCSNVLMGRLRALQAAGCIANSQKGMKEDVARIVSSYTKLLQGKLAEILIPQAKDTLEATLNQVVADAGSDMFKEINALGHKDLPAFTLSVEATTSYLQNTIEAEYSNLITKNGLMLDVDVKNVVQGIVKERMGMLDMLASEEAAMTVFDSQIPQRLQGVAQMIRDGVKEEMEANLAGMKKEVKQATDNALTKFAEYFFEVVGGAVPSPIHSPPGKHILQTFSKCVDDLVTTRLGVYELQRACETGCRTRIPSSEEIEGIYSAQVAHIPPFLAGGFPQVLAELKDGLHSKCQKYIYRESASAYNLVLRELLHGMDVLEFEFKAAWIPHLETSTDLSLPADMNTVLLQSVYESYSLFNSDDACSRWKEHGVHMHRVAKQEINQLFGEAFEATALLTKISTGIENLIDAVVNVVVKGMPHPTHQVLLELPENTTRSIDSVQDEVMSVTGIRPLYVVPITDTSCRLIMDSDETSVQVLKGDFPAGYSTKPCRLPRAMIAGIPTGADGNTLMELVDMHHAIKIPYVTINRASQSAELICTSSADMDLLSSSAAISCLGIKVDFREFPGFDLAIPQAGDSFKFPTREAIMEGLGTGVAFVENIDAETVRVGHWSRHEASRLQKLALEKGFELPARGGMTFLEHFPASSQIDVHMPLDEYRHLQWDPAGYKNAFSEQVDKISRNTPPDQLGSALHKDQTLRNYRRMAMLATLATCEDRSYKLAETGERVNLGPATLDTVSFGNTLPDCGPPKYSETKVIMHDGDMVELSREIVKQGQEVLMLNMANPKEPGGGWNVGVAAQEEDLFRRSDYAHGVTTLGVAGQNAVYPMAQYGCILTSGVTIFRASEQEGYAFMEDPFKVHIIAVAAINAHNYVPEGSQARAPTMAKLPDGERVLLDPISVLTRRKIETLFRVAISKGYDNLVLSALGCGAFGNPSLSVANVFHELLVEYAGYFKQVHFAILNERTYATFQGIISKEYKVGPNQVKHIMYPTEKEFCLRGAQCQDTAHRAKAYHVPLCMNPRDCPKGKVKGYNLHRLLFGHVQQCPQQALCKLLDDPGHCTYFDHPTEWCDLQGNCQSMDLEHLRERRHVPQCEAGGPNECPQYNNPQHRMTKRHPQKLCSQQGHCYNLDDTHHLSVFSHPFQQPCPDTPHCSNTNPEHLSQFAHVCPKGSGCDQKNDPEHRRLHVHFPPHPCANPTCRSMDDDHINTFAHADIMDIRKECPTGDTCPLMFDKEHIKTFSHPDRPHDVCQVHPLISENESAMGVDEFKQYRDNAAWLQKQIRNWMTQCKIAPPKTDSPDFRRIVQFFEKSRPVHRCSFDKFQNMLRTGAVLSLDCVRTLVKDVSQMVELVLTHPIVAPICENYMEHRSSLGQIVKLKLLLCIQDEMMLAPDPDTEPGDMFSYDPSKRQYYSQSLQKDYGPLLIAMQSSMPAIDNTIKGVVQSAMEVRKSGIGFSCDTQVGTDKTIFTIQGINIAGNYGRIRLIFHPDIMYHPNFFVTPMAAVFFCDNETLDAKYALNRPWIGDGLSYPFNSGGAEVYQQHQLHPAVDGTYEALAMEFVARVVHLGKLRDASKVKWEDIMKYWHTYTHNLDPNTPAEQRELETSHWAPEGHCPYSMPLSYVEHVVMSAETLQETFNAEMQASLKQLIKNVHIESSEQAAHEKAVELATGMRRDRKGFCFSLVNDVNETYVPLTRAPTKPMHLYFKAKGAFALVFSSETSDRCATRVAYTMIIRPKGECVVFEGSTLTPTNQRKILAEVTDFNKRLDAEDFIFYYVSVDVHKNEMILDHWGPSELHTTTQGLTLSPMPPLPSCIKYVSFKALDAMATLHDVHDATVRKPPVVTEGLPTGPPCRDGVRCPLAYYTDAANATHIGHTAEFMHPCQWGEQCPDTSPEHKARFTHHRAPLGLCPQGNQCKQVQVPEHRSQFTHPGLKAFMLACPHGAIEKCPEANKPSHFLSYHHAGAEAADQGFATKYQVVEVDDENIEGDIYNMAVAGKTAFGDDVQRDAHGVALGSDYDLATPGSRKGWNILIGNFGNPEELTQQDLEQCAFVSLRNLGFHIEYTAGERDFVNKLTEGPPGSLPKPTHHLAGIPRNKDLITQWHVVWVISGRKFRDIKTVREVDFVQAIIENTHLRGNGLLIWGENDPFYYHANLLLPFLRQGEPGMRLYGNTCGKGKVMRPGNASIKLQYGSHMITTGVEKLFEGNTICYPTFLASFKVLGTSSANLPVLLYADARNAAEGYCGRVVIDNGWTKLMPSLWDTAGTPRYISNVTSWLAFLERMSRKYKMPSSTEMPEDTKNQIMARFATGKMAKVVPARVTSFRMQPNPASPAPAVTPTYSYQAPAQQYPTYKPPSPQPYQAPVQPYQAPTQQSQAPSQQMVTPAISALPEFIVDTAPQNNWVPQKTSGWTGGLRTPAPVEEEEDDDEWETEEEWETDEEEEDEEEEDEEEEDEEEESDEEYC